MLEIDKIKTLEELNECLEISFSPEYLGRYDSNGLEIDKEYCKLNLVNLARRGDFFRVVKYKGKLVGWIAAKIIAPYLHSRDKVLHQLYYSCKLEGYIAAKALVLTHEEMINTAREKNIKIVVTSSDLDNYESFNRILIKHGWIKRNKSLIYPIN